MLKKFSAALSAALFAVSAMAVTAHAQFVAPTKDSIKTSVTDSIEDGGEYVAAMLVAALAIVVIVALARKAPKLVAGVIRRL